MALTATFAADFNAFTKSLEGAKANLRVFDREAKNASRSLTRELATISGQKVAAEAAKMAEAVKRLGAEGGTAAGLLKLTDAELKRVQATMAAATEKAERLGEALPDSIRHVNEAIAKLPKPVDETNRGFGLLGASFAKLTAAFSAASLIDRVVSGVVSFGAAAVQSAGDLVDLSKATGVSIGTLQRWGHVTKLGGIQLDDMTTAAFKLGAAIDGGGKSVRDGVDRLGLSFQRLKGLKPEEQMDEILRAADQLGPVQERNAILVELFGNRGAQALARVVDGYSETARAAHVAGDEQIEALDRAADRWDTFIHDIETGFARAMGNVVLAIERLEGAPGGKGMEGFIGGGEFDPLLAQQAEAKNAAAALDELNARLSEWWENQRRLGAELSQSHTKNYVAELAALKQTLDALTPAQREQLDAAIKLDATTDEITRRFGLSEAAQKLYASSVKDTTKSLSDADNFQAKFNDSLTEHFLKAKKAREELERFIKTTNVKVQFGGDTLADMTKLLEQRWTAPMAKAIAANLTAQRQYQRELDVLTESRTLTRLEAESAAIDRWASDQKAALDTTTAAWRASADAIDAVAKARKEALVADEAAESFIEQMRRDGAWAQHLKDLRDQQKALRDEMASTLRDLASAFATLAQATGRQDGLLGNIGNLISTMSLGATAGGAFKDVLDRMGETGKMTAADFIGLASSALAAVAAMENATDVAGRLNRVLGGIATGASIGAQLGGKWGAVIGGLVGGLVGALRQPGWEDVMNRVGRDWGVQITEGLAREIDAQAKKLFGGNRQAAEIFNIGKIIEEAGGLTPANLDQMTAKLRDVFALLEQGMFDAAQAAKVLDDNFQQFVEAATDESGALSEGMREIIRLTRQMGVESQAVTRYLREQAEAAIEGANAVLGYLAKDYERFKEIADGIKEAQRRIDELNKTPERGRGVEWMRSMQEAQDELTRFLTAQHAAAEASRDELELLGQIAVGVYGAAIAAGMSHSEALRAALPGLSQLVQAYEHLGISAEDAGLKALLAQAKVMQNNPQLLAGIDGLAQSFTALANMGLLNADTFQKMQEAGMRMFTRLQAEMAAAGMDMSTNLHALIPMQEYLRAAAREAARLGIPLDANTQMLIDQSKELGIWKEDGEEGAETVQDAMKELNETLRELIRTMRGIPSEIETTIKTKYVTAGDPPADSSRYLDPRQDPDRRLTGRSIGNPGAPDFGGRSTTLNVPVYLDGHQVAMAVVPNLPAALRRRGVVASWP